MFFEIYKQGNLIVRGKQILNTISLDNELMLAPSTTLILPAEWLKVLDGREEVKIFLDECRVFWGIVWDITVNKEDETIELDVRHIVTEWQYRQISVNHAISNTELNIVYVGEKIERNKGNDETITANGFTASVDEGKQFSDDDLIERARASAWVTSNGDKVDITSVKIQKCTTEESDDEDEEAEETCTDATLSEEGTYRVTFSTAKGTSVSIDVSLEKKVTPTYDVLEDPTVADKLQDIYNDKNFAYPGWEIDFRDGSEDEMIDYVYSRQNKLEALTQTMELTDDLWWRVGLWNEKRIEIGRFGDIKPYTISKKPSGESNIRIIGEPTIDYDFENVVNVATVYSDKSDGGMSSLTLREVYDDPDLQLEGFPVVILHANVNNERDYTQYITQYPKLAPNNEIEYAVIDEESIALESGTVIEGTYSFNDLSPFEIDGETITDEKRIEAAETVYHAVIKKLRQARRSYDIRIVTEPIPCDLEVGDRVRFLYDNNLWNMEACSSYWKKILSYDDWFYVTAITYNYDEYGNLTNELTLTKWLKIERETSNQ